MQMMTKAVKGLLIVNIAAYIINVLVGMVWGLNLNALFGLFYVESPYFTFPVPDSHVYAW